MSHLAQPSREPRLTYAGFWARTGATLIDAVVLIPLLLVVHLLVYWNSPYVWSNHPPVDGRSSLDGIVKVAVVVAFYVTCWRRWRATPGKLLLNQQVVDAQTGQTVTHRQAFLRYIGYVLSSLVLGLGYLWAAWDPKKQCWHDKLAGTVVVRTNAAQEVHFPTQASSQEPRLER